MFYLKKVLKMKSTSGLDARKEENKTTEKCTHVETDGSSSIIVAITKLKNKTVQLSSAF